MLTPKHYQATTGFQAKAQSKRAQEAHCTKNPSNKTMGLGDSMTLLNPAPAVEKTLRAFGLLSLR